MQNSNPMSIFVGHDLETSIIQKKLFSRIIENIRYGGRVSMRKAEMGLAQRLGRDKYIHHIWILQVKMRYLE